MAGNINLTIVKGLSLDALYYLKNKILTAANTYTNNQIDALVDGAPAALDTLNEIALKLSCDGDMISSLLTTIGNKVDKETGKGLSTNDYTTTEKNKLANIAAGAEVNVQSDWNLTTTTADDYIKNKPTNVSAFTNDSGYITSSYIIDGDAAYSEHDKAPSGYSVNAKLSGKLDTLSSGVNIKTINNESLLGSGNITISAGSNISISQSMGVGTSATIGSTTYNIVADSIPNGSNISYIAPTWAATMNLLKLSNDYVPSILENEDLELSPNDTYEVAFGKLHKAILDNEQITSASLIDLNSRIPTNVSDLLNDSGFITSYTETDPTVLSWAKALYRINLNPINTNSLEFYGPFTLSSYGISLKTVGRISGGANSSTIERILDTNDYTYNEGGWEHAGYDTTLMTMGAMKQRFATKDSPAFTGTPTAPTASSGTNTTQIATTAFVLNAIANSDGIMWVTFTTNNDVITCDETISNIIEALRTGKTVLGKSPLLGEWIFYPTAYVEDTVTVLFRAEIMFSEDTPIISMTYTGTIESCVDTWETVLQSIPVNFEGVTINRTGLAKTTSNILSVELSADDVDYERLFLTFVALESGTFTFSVNNLYYSIDNGVNWNELTAGTASPTVLAGNKILWRNSGLTPTENDGIGTFSSTGRFNVYGNVMSLYYDGGFFGKKDLTGKAYAFRRLFLNCTTVIDASHLILPATTLSESCYRNFFNYASGLVYPPELPAENLVSNCYSVMFQGCTSLVRTPLLRSTHLADSCYYYMFNLCSSLVECTDLPATKLYYVCYCNMFKGCSSLTSVPFKLIINEIDNTAETLPGENACEYMFRSCTSLVESPYIEVNCTLATRVLKNMFTGCSSLTKITLKCDDANYLYTNDGIRNWMETVPAVGTFVLCKSPSALSYITLQTGASGVLSGWTLYTGEEYAFVRHHELSNIGHIKVFDVVSTTSNDVTTYDYGTTKFSDIKDAYRNVDAVFLRFYNTNKTYPPFLIFRANECIGDPGENNTQILTIVFHSLITFLNTAVMALTLQAGDNDSILTSQSTVDISNKQDAISDLDTIRSNAGYGVDAWNALGNYQELLVSGTNIKTINNQSLLGSGNITIQGGDGDTNVIETVKVNGTALTPDANKAINITSIPSSIVTQDVTHRFVSDTEKSTWNSKLNALQHYSEPGDGALILVYVDNTGEGTGSNGEITLSCIDEMLGAPLAELKVSRHEGVNLYHEYFDSSLGITTLSQTVYIGDNGIKLNYHTFDNLGHEVELSTAGFKYDNKQIATIDQIPSAVTESTVSGWGFTKNTGTITGVSVNNTSVATSGVANITVPVYLDDLLGSSSSIHVSQDAFDAKGTYSKPSGGIPKTDLASAVQTSLGLADTALQPSAIVDNTSFSNEHSKAPSGYAVSAALQGKADSATTLAGYGITDAKIESGTITLGSNIITPLTSHLSIKTVNNNTLVGTGNVTIATPGTLKTDNTTALTTANNESLSGTVNLHKISKTGNYNDLIDKPTIPSAVTESTVSGWGFTKNAGTITSVTGSNGLTGSGSSGSVTISHAAPSTSPAKSTSAVYPITIDQYGHITATGTAVTIPTQVTESTVSGWGFTKNVGTVTSVEVNGTTASLDAGGCVSIEAITGVEYASHPITATNGVVDILAAILAEINAAKVTIYSGTAAPSNSLGTNGDLYLLTS